MNPSMNSLLHDLLEVVAKHTEIDVAIRHQIQQRVIDLLHPKTSEQPSTNDDGVVRELVGSSVFTIKESTMGPQKSLIYTFKNRSAQSVDSLGWLRISFIGT